MSDKGVILAINKGYNLHGLLIGNLPFNCLFPTNPNLLSYSIIH